MKKFICALIVALVDSVAHCGPIANLDYIHTLIADRWNITIPFNRNITNINAAANMKYLLTTIDVANEILNGEATTDYGNGEFATMFAADTIAADTAVETLVKKPEKYKFSATVDLSLVDAGWAEPMTSFGFMLGAMGTFYVDWGDGTEEVIEKTNTDAVEYLHDYGTSSGVYIVKIGGRASEYSDDEYTPAISFGMDYAGWTYRSEAITAISGSLGAIFPTLSDGSQPRFNDLFVNSYIAEIPSELFDGIHGEPVSNMFWFAFDNLYELTSIPENLFAGISGPPADGMFAGTFYYTGITSIPENLFAGISGPPTIDMFSNTFVGARITSIPENLFAGIQGPPAERMFNRTFTDSRITSIPSGLFAGISGPPASDMFAGTFEGTRITSIPENLFAGIQGPPAERMFDGTFAYSGITSIPENLFAGIRGAPAEQMFYGTFSDCYYLTGPSAKTHGQYLYDIWPDATEGEVGGMYDDATGLDDYKYIPTAWGGLGQERPIEYKLSLTHQWPLMAHGNNVFKNPDALMYISAAGKFYIDWGDGTTEVIEKENTDELAIDHEYAQAGTYTVRIGGRATAYSDDPYTSTAILGGPVMDDLDRHRMGLLRVSGCLGCVFPTLSDGSQPRFISTFESAENCVNTTLPDGFLVGIHGAPVSNMFMYTFTGWLSLNTIPDNLFAGLDTTAPAVEGMFTETFGWCIDLTGPSAKINGQYLYDIWPDATTDEVGGMYHDATGLSDYSSIPDAWK